MQPAAAANEALVADLLGELSTISDASRDAFLQEIPSETTLGERQLLFRLFKDQWAGAGHVVEIGPFLGGTTRAIAWGMAQNPRLTPGAELHTFDRFGPYYTPENLRQMVAPVVERGALDAVEADRLCHLGGFLALFEAIHRPHDYFRLIRVHDSPLPDRPEEVDSSQALACFENDHELGGLFIDGCKSWASTHYAMRYLLPRTRLGAPVIFQDFGWYTCFWISAFAHALGDFLAWETHVDSTYVFRLKKPVTTADVVRRFSKAPEAMTAPFFKRAHAALLERCRAANDRRGELIAHLHLVAALITIGRKREAADVLKALDVQRFAAFVGMIRGCIKSPTYRPGGQQILWTE